MALGEAQIISDTRDALAAAGVDLAALDALAGSAPRGASADAKGAAVPRSTSVILVKNLPFVATAAELTQLFSRFGTLSRLVLPPTRTLALVSPALLSLIAATQHWEGFNIVAQAPGCPSLELLGLMLHTPGAQRAHPGLVGMGLRQLSACVAACCALWVFVGSGGDARGARGQEGLQVPGIPALPVSRPRSAPRAFLLQFNMACWPQRGCCCLPCAVYWEPKHG